MSKKEISKYLGPEHISLSDIDRFFKKVSFLENGCWFFDSWKCAWGYGRFKIYNADQKRIVKSHRFSYVIHKGKINPDKLVRHSCDNAGCVNPEHLAIGTSKDNYADMVLRGRDLLAPAGINRAKTHCKNGHEFTLENTYTRNRPGGGRICKACAFIRKGFHYDGKHWRKTIMATPNRSNRKSKE